MDQLTRWILILLAVIVVAVAAFSLNRRYDDPARFLIGREAVVKH